MRENRREGTWVERPMIAKEFLTRNFVVERLRGDWSRVSIGARIRLYFHDNPKDQGPVVQYRRP